MEIFNLDRRMILPKLEINSCTIGNFDGLHLGHQKLIEDAKVNSFKSLVITFDDIFKDKIITLENKIKKIEEFEIDYLIILKFEDFKDMFHNEFVKMLKKINVKRISIGKDFRFGFKKEGDYIDLQNKFETYLIDEVEVNNEKVSSTLIRSKLKEGKIKEANELLGYNFFLTGEVKNGNELGRTIGFPTANLEVDTLLNNGVYKTQTTVDDVLYNSITNIGYNPTFNEQKQLRIETNILDFNEDIYGKEIKVEFIDKIREEIRFQSKEHLQQQLNEDKSVW